MYMQRMVRKMERKIVFFDIDGTLLNHDKKLVPSAKTAIEQLKKNGIFVAIATGRAPFMFKDLREELGIDSYVSFNGQYVVFENKVIYKNALNKQLLLSLLEKSTSKNHPIVFMNESKMRANVKNHPYITTSMNSLKFQHPPYDPSFFLNQDIYQALLFCTGDEESQYIHEFQDFCFIRWHEVSVDVLPNGGSKAEGIKRMIEQLGIKRENTIAFGDGLNDMEMLDFVGTGVAMGNALDEVKRKADEVTKDVADNGIRFGLEKLGLLT